MKWAVLVGGTGSNLRALLEQSLTVGLVISHRADAGALDIARSHGIAVCTLLPRDYPSRASYGQALRHQLTQAKIDAIALAGFMRWLDGDTVQAWWGKIFNIHPSLLPAFSGLHAVRQALAYGVSWTGVTVHVVDQGEDSGPIVAQIPIAVLPGDSEESLSERIHQVEHRLYAAVLKAFEAGSFYVDGRQVVWNRPVPGLERGNYAVGIDQCH